MWCMKPALFGYDDNVWFPWFSFVTENETYRRVARKPTNQPTSHRKVRGENQQENSALCMVVHAFERKYARCAGCGVHEFVIYDFSMDAAERSRIVVWLCVCVCV